MDGSLGNIQPRGRLGPTCANPSHDAWPASTSELKRVIEPIQRAAWRRGLPPSEVDDVIQDALCQAWLKRNEFDGSRSMIRWLYGFGLRAILARRRVRSSLEKWDAEFSDLTTGEPTPEEHAEAREDRHLMRAIVAHAPLSYRKVLLARYWRGQSVSDVATALGISTRAAEGRLARALRWMVGMWSRPDQTV